jgi:hypothetical protein
MRHLIIITTPKHDVVSPQMAIAIRDFLETRNIPVASVVETTEKEVIDAITAGHETKTEVEIPQIVIDSMRKVATVINRMRKAGVSNHDITNAIAVATIVDSGMNKNLDILKENIQYVSPDIRIIIDPIWQGHVNR